MMQASRAFPLVQAAAFLTAALTHLGLLIGGYEHKQAGTAEGVIGGVLLAGVILTLIRPASARAISIAVQSFALLGTAVGIFTIAIGVGPRSIPDIVFHIGIVILLVSGLVLTVRSTAARSETPRS